MTYFRTFKLGRLYFKFIKGTCLEADQWTSEKLAAWLEANKFIKMVWVQSKDAIGRFEKGEPRYYELSAKQIKRSELIKILKRT